MQTTSQQELANERFLLACENGDLDMARAALAKGAKAEEPNGAGETALHLAVKSGNREMVHFIIHELHINTEVRDAFGRTPLHWAAQQGNAPVVETLLLSNASISAKDDMGVEAKIYAEMAGHKELVKIFGLVRSTRK